jgi:4-amino-4-deoxy-L-arabinose transferase-like glycosyltransferase
MYAHRQTDEGTSLKPLVWLAAATAAVMFVFPLWVRFPLVDPDEGLHAAIAQEMVERGHWLTPSLLGKPFWDKPILYCWLQAASLRLLGPNEAAVRLPGLMFGLLGAVTTGLLAWRLWEKGDRHHLCEAPGTDRRLVGPFRQMVPARFFPLSAQRTGLIAGILYATLILPTALAQAPSHDVALVPWINLTLLCLWESGRAAGRRFVAACLLGAGAALGLSILTKGLAGVAVVAVAYGGCQLLAWISFKFQISNWRSAIQRWRVPSRAATLGAEPRPVARDPRPPFPFRSACLRAALVLSIAILVAVPWYMVAQAQNPNYLSYYLIDRHLLGFATGTQPHGDQPWWYYLPLLLGGGLPWIGYLPAAVRGQGSEAGSGTDEDRRPKIPNFKFQISNFKFQICDLQFPIRRWLFPSQPVPLNPESQSLNPDPRSPSLDPRPLLWCWLVGWLLFLTVARSKLVTYLWPAFPTVAILAALAWAGAIEGTLGQKSRGSLARTFVFSSLSGPVVLPLALLVLQAVFGLRYGWPVWAAVAIVAAAAPLPLVPWRAGRAQAGLAAAVLCVSAQFVVAMTMVLPPAAEIYSARALAEHFNRLGRLPARLYMAEERIGSLVFYLDPRLRAGLKPDQVVQVRAPQPLLLRPGDFVAVPDQQRYRTAGWLDLDGNPCETVGRYRLYCVSH